MRRCASCDHSCNFVYPDGPTTSKIVFIGEKPGKNEDKYQVPFIGDAGREFNKNYLSLAGLSRSSIYITNTVKCRLGGNNTKPTAQQISDCVSTHLLTELQSIRPKIVVLLGATACSLYPSLNVDRDHGLPRLVGECGEGWLSSVLANDTVIVPMYHPALGLHDTTKMTYLFEDFTNLGRYMRGKWKPNRVTYAPDYKIASRSEIKHHLANVSTVGVDTEDDCGRAWSIQYSHKAGVGRMVLVEDRKTSQYLLDALSEKTVVFHNHIHDLDVLEQLGANITDYRDTMQEVYHLGNLPQGLKPLAWRLLGIDMQSWEDLVTPYSKDLMVGWMFDRLAECEPERVEKVLPKFVAALTKTGKPTKASLNPANIFTDDGEWIYARWVTKPTKFEKDLQRIISHSEKETYDVWEKAAEAGFTGYPRRSIANVPLEEAIQYGCRDADVTLQAYHLVGERREQQMREWDIPEQDWDK